MEQLVRVLVLCTWACLLQQLQQQLLLLQARSFLLVAGAWTAWTLWASLGQYFYLARGNRKQAAREAGGSGMVGGRGGLRSHRVKL